MTNQNLLPDSGNTSVSLEDLSALCQDNDWMDRFILDTQEHHLLHAPSRMMQETLDRCSAPSSRANERSRREWSGKKPFSKQMQLFIYSLRVSAAAAGAIILLFATPPAGHSVYLETKASRLQNFSNSIYEFSNDLFQREVTPNDQEKK